MRSIAIKILSSCARAVLRKYQPKIVAVTGTVGKSSAKEAAYAVIRHSLVTRASRANYNTAIGVPLTVLDIPAPGRSLFGWLRVLMRTFVLLIKTDHNYPDVLILEMGADRPGDIDELTAIARPHIAVLTSITPVHLQTFGTIAAIQKEKVSLWRGLRENGTAIGAVDDPRVLEEIQKVKGKTLTYGFSSIAAIRAGETAVFQSRDENIDDRIKGMAFKLYSDGSVLPVHLSGVLGRPHIAAALAGAAVGSAMGLNYHEIVEGLHGYKPMPGRLRLIGGIKHTLLIDDSYNSSPSACEIALEELKSVPIGEGNKIYAILGDMLELGADSEKFHAQIGRRAAQLGIDVLIAVGELSAEAAAAAREAGMDEGRVFHFGKAEEAGRFAQERIKKGDVILIKGSRGMKMERVVKELMAEPLRAEELLVQE